MVTLKKIDFSDHAVSQAMLDALHALPHLVKPKQAGIIIPVLQERKTTLREVSQLSKITQVEIKKLRFKLKST